MMQLSTRKTMNASSSNRAPAAVLLDSVSCVGVELAILSGNFLLSSMKQRWCQQDFSKTQLAHLLVLIKPILIDFTIARANPLAYVYCAVVPKALQEEREKTIFNTGFAVKKNTFYQASSSQLYSPEWLSSSSSSPTPKSLFSSPVTGSSRKNCSSQCKSS